MAKAKSIDRALREASNYFKKVHRGTVRTADPRKAQLGPGQVLVHNHVVPAATNGWRGFRFWKQDKDNSLVECPCYWAGWNADGKVKHYRFRATLPDGFAKLPPAELKQKLLELAEQNEKLRLTLDRPRS
jgi:hypothetical protein